jgi:hypothetical protein
MQRLFSLVAVMTLAAYSPPTSVDVLHAVGGLPGHIVAEFRDATTFVETASGESIVLDAGTHTVFAVDKSHASARAILTIGPEAGRLFLPRALSLSPDDLFAVADAPNNVDRIQYFSASGARVGGFYLPDRLAGPRMTVAGLSLTGLGAVTFAGTTFFVHLPGRGVLISEIDTQGATVRQFGTLRATGHESDAAVHALLNIGIPLVDPTGGFYFVFQTGTPMFRKYDAKGDLVFERHIEGVELDDQVRTLPTVWRARNPGDDRQPIAIPLVRTAAVDRTGRLWISLITPYTYVYEHGDKVRTVQFEGAGTIAPNSLFFAPGGRLLITPGCYEFTIK